MSKRQNPKRWIAYLGIKILNIYSIFYKKYYTLAESILLYDSLMTATSCQGTSIRACIEGGCLLYCSLVYAHYALFSSESRLSLKISD